MSIAQQFKCYIFTKQQHLYFVFLFKSQDNVGYEITILDCLTVCGKVGGITAHN